MVCHAVAVPTQLKSVALSTLPPSLPNKRHSSDVSRTVVLSTFLNGRTSDEMWSDVLNVFLPTFVNSRNSDAVWSDVLDVSLPTFVNGRNSDKMWSDVLNVALPTCVNCRNSDEMWSDIFILSLPTFQGCRSSDVYKVLVDRRRVQFKKKNEILKDEKHCFEYII